MLVGIVGKPSAGKSTFFKSITLADIQTASYPFTTIQPNEGVGFVRVKRVDIERGVVANPRDGYLAGDYRFVPVKLLDVAGIVPGAHEGKGLGLQFLDDLRAADVLIHIVDASGSTNEKGESVEPGSHDVCEDIRFLEHELEMWMLGILKKGWVRFARQIATQKGKISEALAKQVSGLNVREDHVKTAVHKLKLDEDPTLWTEEHLRALTHELRVMTKPLLIAANKMDAKTAPANIKKLRDTFPNHTIVACSAVAELALREARKKEVIDYVPGAESFNDSGEITPQQKKGLDFIQENILKPFRTTGVQNVLDTAVFELLKKIAIFPGGMKGLGDKDGNILPDCFLLNDGSTAYDFANKIHSDLAAGFIRAVDIRTKRVVGKDHPLKHRDIIEIISSK